MNSIKDLLPGSMRERTFQLKARRDAGAVWNDPQFVECKKCGRRATRQIWNKAQYVCPNCGVHLPIGGYYRLSLVLDKGSFRELDADLAPQDVLQFPGYPEKLEAQTGKTGLKEAVITATGRIEGTPVVAAVLDSRFFMGSMSTTVGEKIGSSNRNRSFKHILQESLDKRRKKECSRKLCNGTFIHHRRCNSLRSRSSASGYPFMYRWFCSSRRTFSSLWL